MLTPQRSGGATASVGCFDRAADPANSGAAGRKLQDARPLAIFDLDGTLTTRDCFLAFLITFGRRHSRFGALARTPPRLAAYMAKRLPDFQLKQDLIRDFLGVSDLETVAAHAEWFCENWLPRFFHPIGMRLLDVHRERGDRLILLSASPSIFVPAVARVLRIEEAVCTTIETLDQRWTGRILDGNCKGARKLERVQAYLGGPQAPPASFAYGDSPSDQFVLRWVEHGAWIRRRRMEPLRNDDRTPFPIVFPN